MSEEGLLCSYIIDTGGLHDIATATGNLKTIALNHLKKGDVAVSSWAWQELKEAYPDEAEELSHFITKRVIMKQSISVGAARIAERLNSGFSTSPYDNHTRLFTAAAAASNGYRVITSESDLSAYENMGCDVCDVQTWIDELHDE
jgi:hypothetical protein